MLSFLNAAVVLLPLAYLLVVVDYAILFMARDVRAKRWAPALLGGTLALHLAYLVGLGFEWGQLPAATVPQMFSVVAFAVATAYALVEWLGEERSTGVWTLGLAFGLQLVGSVLDRPEPPHLELFHSPIFVIHVCLALLGYAAFVIAAVYGFLFLRLYRELKSGRFRLFFGRLPPLEVLERMLGRSLWVGFLTLSGAVATGLVWGFELARPGWLWHPEIVFTLITWLLYGGTLALRRLRQWGGRLTAVASLAGLGAIVLSLLVTNFLYRSFHGFGG